MNVKQSLRALNAYPIPEGVIDSILCSRGVYGDTETSKELMDGVSYRLCVADIYMWLTLAPNISQGGQTYSISEDQRKAMRREAEATYSELCENVNKRVKYGYKGGRL